MNTDIIINLVGASGSGKTAIAKELDKLSYNIIQSYTSRRPRYNKEWGHEFIDKFIKIKPPNIIFKFKGEDRAEKLIAYFNNYKKHEHYFATEEQYKDKGTSIYIVDPVGAEQVKEVVTDSKVITIHLEANESVREERLLNSREKDEVVTRLERDRDIFKDVPCDYIINADKELETVLDNILQIIQKEECNGGY